MADDNSGFSLHKKGGESYELWTVLTYRPSVSTFREAGRVGVSLC